MILMSGNVVHGMSRKDVQKKLSKAEQARFAQEQKKVVLVERAEKAKKEQEKADNAKYAGRMEVIAREEPYLLDILGSQLLECSSMRDTEVSKMQTILKVAAERAVQSPYTFFLSGQVSRAAVNGYIPAMYLCAVQCMENSVKQLYGKQKEIVSEMLARLTTQSFLDEKQHKAILLRSLQMHEELMTPEMQKVWGPDLVIEKDISSAVTLLYNAIKSYIVSSSEDFKPWVVRCCYAFGMLQKADLVKISAEDNFDSLWAAAYEGYEPAVYECIKNRIQGDKRLNLLLDKALPVFMQAIKSMRKTVGMPIQKADEALMRDLMVGYHFIETFGCYMDALTIREEALYLIQQKLTSLLDVDNDYRSRCLLALVMFYKNKTESIVKALDIVEPVIGKKEARAFFVEHASMKIKNILQNNLHVDVRVGYIMGVILNEDEKTKTEAIKYFVVASQQGCKQALESTGDLKLAFCNETRERMEKNSLCRAAQGVYEPESGYSIEKNLLAALRCYIETGTTLSEEALLKVESIALSGYPCASCRAFMYLLGNSQTMGRCEKILRAIEDYSEEQFKDHIQQFINYITEIEGLAARGNRVAHCLCGYIYHLQAAQQTRSLHCQSLQLSLNHLLKSEMSPRVRSLIISICSQQAGKYCDSGNIGVAIKFYNIMAIYGKDCVQEKQIEWLLQVIDAMPYETLINVIHTLIKAGYEPEIFKMLVARNNIKACACLGGAFYNTKNYADAYCYCAKAAKAGDMYASVYITCMKTLGCGVQQNLQEVAHLLQEWWLTDEGRCKISHFVTLCNVEVEQQLQNVSGKSKVQADFIRGIIGYETRKNDQQTYWLLSQSVEHGFVYALYCCVQMLFDARITIAESEALVARMLLDAGANVNQQSTGGRTPLHLAAIDGNTEVARMLLDAGADQSIVDNEGNNPLSLAVSEGRAEAANMLFDALEARSATRMREVAVTLAAATHERLGAQSPVALLPQDLLRSIAHLDV
jgi:hypothetical protein